MNPLPAVRTSVKRHPGFGFLHGMKPRLPFLHYFDGFQVLLSMFLVNEALDVGAVSFAFH